MKPNYFYILFIFHANGRQILLFMMTFAFNSKKYADYKMSNFIVHNN